ncbi:MAG: iron-containing alcohol dehydrogenase family protein [Myxococcota bacterium]
MSARIFPFQHAPTGTVVFGAGTAGKLADQRLLRRAERLLVVTDAGVRTAGLLERCLQGLGERVALVDDTVRSDGDADHVDDLAARARASSIDAIVAVGGGSVIDTAKATAAVVAKKSSLASLEGIATVRSALLPIAAVPTTAGTGSEATQFVVITDRAAGRKLILTDTSLVPSLAVLDPELLLTLPREVTAATGVDALSHAVEALGSKLRNPFGTALALEAARVLLAEDGLARCLSHPEDIEARGRVLSAACLAGQAISTNLLGACHAFAHAVGAAKGIPHGVANGLFLGTVMRLNLERVRPAYATLGQSIGGSGEEALLAQHAIGAVERLVHEVAGIPRQLRQCGITEGDVPALAQGVLADPDLATNPVALKDVATVEQLLRERL